MMEFSGKKAVVTGAGSGIGRALVEELLQRGAHVLASDISDASLASLAQAVQEYGDRLATIVTDVADEDSVQELKARSGELLGGVDLLFNNAGVAYNIEPTWNAPAAAVAWCYGVNVHGVLNGLRAFVPDMIAQKRGHIVNTASIGGFQVSDRIDVWQQGIYASTKFSVVAITESLRTELREHGIGVSVLAPSAVATGIAHSGAHRQARFGGSAEAASPEAMATMLEEEGLAPRDVALITLDGVANNRQYIFTDTSLRTRIRERAEQIDLAFDEIPRVNQEAENARS